MKELKKPKLFSGNTSTKGLINVGSMMSIGGIGIYEYLRNNGISESINNIEGFEGALAEWFDERRIPVWLSMMILALNNEDDDHLRDLDYVIKRRKRNDSQ